MRFTIGNAALSRALQVVGKAMPGGATLPIMAGVLVEAADGAVTLRTTDGVASARRVERAVVEEPGSTVLPGRLLAGMSKGLPDEPVTFEQSDGACVVSCARSRMTMRPLDPALFPAFEEDEPAATATLPSPVVAAMVDVTHRMTAKDPSRPYLAGIHVTVGGGRATMSASDSYVMVTCSADADGGPFDALVPATVMRDVAAMASGDVTIGTSGRQASLSFGTTTFLARTVDGTFPNVAMLMDRRPATVATVDAEALAAAVRRVSVMSGDDRAIAVEAGPGAMTLRASSKEKGESTESVTADVEGPAAVVSVSHKHLADVVGPMSGDASIGIDGPAAPVVVECHGAVEVKAMMAPVRHPTPEGGGLRAPTD